MEKADFENLVIWQKAIEYADCCVGLSEKISERKKGHFRILEQLESSALSVPQNISEGKGRNSTREFMQFLYYARGSLNESLTVIILFERRKWITEKESKTLRNMAYELGSMLNGFINGLKKRL